MSWQRVALFGSAALVVLGLVLRALGVAFGLDLMIVAIFIAVIALSFAQRSTQNALATARRSVTQRLQSIGEAQARDHDSLKELSALQRTTLYYAKLRPAGGTASRDEQSPGARSSTKAGRAGRSSTPDVANAAADVTFATLLEPGRGLAIGGVLSEPSRQALPSGTAIKPFLPGRAVESLEASGRLDLVVLDEAALSEAPWSRSAGPAGIAMMRDLLEAVRVAREQGVATVVVPSPTVPDIHSAALARTTVVRLPLDERAIDPAAGAPLTAVLRALDDLAIGRTSA